MFWTEIVERENNTFYAGIFLTSLRDFEIIK
jgi:hypothetical protein